MRCDEERAVTLTADYFNSVQTDGPDVASHFLWNAKMRFGKTFVAYKLAQKMNWTRVVVLIYKPAVEMAWKDDLLSHIDFEGWQFIGHNDNYSEVDVQRPIVWFASFQDILGRTREGKIKPKFEVARLIEWVC